MDDVDLRFDIPSFHGCSCLGHAASVSSSPFSVQGTRETGQATDRSV